MVGMLGGGFWMMQLSVFSQKNYTLPCNRVSAFIEELSTYFQDWLAQRKQEFICSVALFEKYLLAIKKGDNSTYTVHWNVEPMLTLSLIIYGKIEDLPEGKKEYTMLISGNLPKGFEILEQS